ncbi:MAG: AAA family ATPase [Candidatus Eisenbacteria sp.]|nr:AAA family ATPase [Candidatus Eisenbacteria bacterium]
MIRVESITIKEFRGIRDLTLDLKGRNFAVCGPTGTGKSGVVDALEFALTGSVSRLSGEGKGDVSLKQHGPHVDRRNDPDTARVTARVTIPSLRKTVTIERSLKTPATASVTPRDPAVLEVLRQVKAHSEIVLSRRELIRYVLATPGKRAEEVQALLRLDQVEQVRVGLQKIANSCEKQLIPLGTVAAQARDNLLRVLGMPELTTEKVLAAANAQRAILSLPALSDLAEATSLKDGIEAPGPAQPQRIPKAQALADIRATREAFAEIASAPTSTRVAEVTADLTALADDPVVAASVKREAFYATGMEIVEAEACPFCDTAWNLDELKKHVQAKLHHLREISRKRMAAEIKIAPLIVLLRKVQVAIDALVRYAALATPPLAMQGASDYSAYCKSAADRLATVLPLAGTITVLSNVPIVPQAALDAIGDFEKAVAVLPEPTKQDAAREWLTLAQERLRVWRDATRRQQAAKEQAQSARQVSDIYAVTSDKVLAGIYSDVEKDFAALYRSANRDDEDKFDAKLVPSMGKLGLDVDFYGRGFFPPGAYHSEGHQDSMGLCLYLALMRHVQGAGFTLAVLDDVLMSVDAGHRREVCALLKTEFPNTQFIMTTHDPIWLRHMKTAGLIAGRSAVQFRNWSVDLGPAQWDERDVWTEIDDHLKGNDVRAAAALLRHYLEYVAAEVCHRLRAPVEFHGDAQYQLGELLPAAIAQMRKLYGRAKEAANSWNHREVIGQLSARESEFARLADTSKAEQWQVNVAVHYNSWDNLAKEDFAPVAMAFRELLGGFTCSDCGEYLRVSPSRETPEAVRCGCGKTNIDLRKKRG